MFCLCTFSLFTQMCKVSNDEIVLNIHCSLQILQQLQHNVTRFVFWLYTDKMSVRITSLWLCNKRFPLHELLTHTLSLRMEWLWDPFCNLYAVNVVFVQLLPLVNIFMSMVERQNSPGLLHSVKLEQLVCVLLVCATIHFCHSYWMIVVCKGRGLLLSQMNVEGTHNPTARVYPCTHAKRARPCIMVHVAPHRAHYVGTRSLGLKLSTYCIASVRVISTE